MLHSIRATSEHKVPRHGNKELGKGLLKEILNQAGISIEEFKQDFLR